MALTPASSSLALAERLNVTALVATVQSAERLSPHLMVVTLAGASAIGGVPGNDVMVVLTDGDTHTNRRYSLRSIDPETDTATLWIATNHDGLGARWAQSCAPGDTVDLVGPRGKIPLDPMADWHLFIGDITGLPAFYRMAESIEVPGKAIFIVEVDEIADAVTATFDEGLGVTGIFVERNGRAFNDPAGLTAGLAAFDFPEHTGHAYVFSEFSVVRAITTLLKDRGLSPEQISTKNFYRVGRANAANGEPERD